MENDKEAFVDIFMDWHDDDFQTYDKAQIEDLFLRLLAAGFHRVASPEMPVELTEARNEIGRMGFEKAELRSDLTAARQRIAELEGLLTESIIHVEAAQENKTLTDAGKNHAKKLAKRVRAAIESATKETT